MICLLKAIVSVILMAFAEVLIFWTDIKVMVRTPVLLLFNISSEQKTFELTYVFKKAMTGIVYKLMQSSWNVLIYFKYFNLLQIQRKYRVLLHGHKLYLHTRSICLSSFPFTRILVLIIFPCVKWSFWFESLLSDHRQLMFHSYFDFGRKYLMSGLVPIWGSVSWSFIDVSLSDEILCKEHFVVFAVIFF